MKSKTFPADLLHLLTRATTVAALFVLFAAGLQVNAQRNRTALTSKTSTLAVKTTTDPGTTSVVSGQPAIDIDQCANGGVNSPHIPCAGSAWQNGNLNGNQSHYKEGDFVPYRDKFTDLTNGGTYTFTIQWDTTQGGKHALDYLGTYFNTETLALGNDPCSGFTGCTLTQGPQFPIDPQVTSGFDETSGTPDDITYTAGYLYSWGATNISISPTYGYDGSFADNAKTSLTISFTASGSTAVFAWSGHISTRKDWGFTHSAIAISGSPYHMRNIAFTGTDVHGTVGNQDRSLSADAVIYPGTLTVIKTVETLNGSGINSTFFPFTTTGLLGLTFSLQDTYADAPVFPYTGRNDVYYSDQIGAVSGFPISGTLVESLVAGWSDLPDIDCTMSDRSGNPVGTVSPTSGNGRTATFTYQEGNDLVCTYNNIQGSPTAATASITGRVITRTGSGISGATVSAFDGNTGVTKSARTNSFGYYTISGLTINDFIVMNASAKGYTFTSGGQEFVLGGDLAGVNFQAK